MAKLRPDSSTVKKFLVLLIASSVFPTTAFAQSAGAGTSHTSIVTTGGGVWSWGNNGWGQLGDTSTSQRVLPVNASPLPTATAVADGDSHTVALTSDGNVYAWGNNTNGQLGNGSTTYHTSPVQTNTVSSITAVAAGYSHSVALKSDGTVWTWGDNTYGQLGNNSTTQQTSPVQVLVSVSPNVPLTNVVAIAAGSYHTLAVKSDGTVWAWGRNSNYQLGDNTLTQRLMPVQVVQSVSPTTVYLTNVVAVAAGTYHSLALKSDGSVKAWGYNAYGQLGDSTTNQQTMPVSVVNIPAASSIAAGAFHSFLISAQDSSLWAWGDNDYGQLGDGSKTRHSIAVAVTSLSNVSKVAGGQLHSVAVTTDGTVWAWGQNTNGQVGDGTTVLRLLPVKVTEASYAWKVGTPTFNQGTGTYPSIINVTVATATSGATIHYTTNGVDPTESDPTVASGSTVSITQTLTLKAKAWKSGVQPSNVDGNVYTLQIPQVSFSPGTNIYNVNQNVTVSSSVSGATIHYTTNGVDPTESDPTVTSGSTVSVTQSLVLKAGAWKSGWTPAVINSATYTMKVGTPGVSPAAGNYSSAQTVTVSEVTAGATLHYTVNGAEPTTSDPVIAAGGTIAVGTATTLRIKGWLGNWTTGDSRVATYTFTLGTVATPTMTPVGGTYTSAQSVAIATATSGATIRYTLDGSDPTLLSAVYTAPLTVSAPGTIKARAFKADNAGSAVGTAAYAFTYGTVDIPTLTPPGGTYTTTQTVTVSTTTPGATLHYTTTGFDPTESDPTVASGGTITVTKSQRLKAAAWLTGTPQSAVRIGDYTITGAVSAGSLSVLALKSDGTVWSWGLNNNGQLGNGTTTTPQKTPLQTAVLTDIVAIAAGGVHGLALKRDGTVWGWGQNTYGEVGKGSTSNWEAMPVQVVQSASPLVYLTNVVAIAAGFDHSLAIKSDGTLWAWGDNTDGELGDGTTSARSSATQITTLTGVSAIAAGNYFSVVLKTDGATSGSVWTFGRQLDGQLGEGATGVSSRNVPAEVLPGASALGAGTTHGFAVMADGTGRAWGKNIDGRLGDGTNTAQFKPVPVLDLPNIAALDGGDTFSVGTTTDGSAWAWGVENLIGIELNGAANVPIPSRVPGAGLPVVGVSAGNAYAVAVRLDGTVCVWGDDTYGEWGNNTTNGTTNYPLPQTVPNFSLADQSWLMGDQDNDGLPTWRELQLGTDPVNPDTNGDGLRDGAAVAAGISATSLDTDGDGVPNSVEIANGTDPLRADTDGDGFCDGTGPGCHGMPLDCFPLDPTRGQCPVADPNDHTPPVITLQYPTNAVPLP